ncbi:MAG: flagellar type III secretion system pore protein FliP [Myxococcota bacterium]
MWRRALLVGALLALPAVALAEAPPVGLSDLAQATNEPEVAQAVRWIVALTAMTVLPGIVMLMTPFTRIVIVLSLVRQALGLQQSPPNQVLIALALVLSMAVMQPTLEVVQRDAVQPYLAGEIETGAAWDAAMGPMRRFMLAHTERDELRTAIKIARIPRPETLDDLPLTVVVTGYVLSELQTAFVTAVKVYLPFLVVDLVTASILLGTGMMMLPPVVLSMPFKLLLFVLMDGWSLLVLGLTGANQ